MSLTVRIHCPRCRSEDFSISSESESYEALIGATCNVCGDKLTEEEITKQIETFGAQQIENIIKGSGI